tara:strand:+ start:1218 stop:1841 length:624 start_codon:yes stop_codon:yes gene_type:complete
LKTEKNKNILIDEIVSELSNGGVCILPTDTYYSLSVIADKPSAISNLFEIKERDLSKPVPILISSLLDVEKYCDISSEPLQKLAQSFWPGPLTIVLPLINEFPKEINNGSGFLGVRVPNHSFTQKVIESLGKPITGTSANISNVAPTKDLNEIKDTFSKKVSIIAEVDCGPENLSSTVIKIDNNKSGIDILREGPISLEKIKKVINL